MADQNWNCNLKYEISSWYHWLSWIRVHNSEIQNNESNMAEWNNRNKQIARREFYGNFYHTQCGNLVFYGHSGDFCHTCLRFYYACGNIRHTEYGNNSHTIDFHTVL